MLQAAKMMAALQVVPKEELESAKPHLTEGSALIQPELITDSNKVGSGTDADFIEEAASISGGAIAPPMIEDAAYYDPYYYDDYYYSGNNNIYGYKGDVHAMVWPALAQIAIPTIIFNQLDQHAYADFFGYDRATTQDATTTDHYDAELTAWANILPVQAGIYGPMALLGLLSLSHVWERPTSKFIEYVLSNMYLPAAIYTTYEMYVAAAATNTWQSYTKLGVWAVSQLLAVEIIMNTGTHAMYYLVDANHKYTDSRLFPELFYWLRWIEHEKREEQDDYYYYDYYGPYY